MEKSTIKKVLKNELIILTGRSNEAKTSFMCDLISSYKKFYSASVYTFNFSSELVKVLGTIPFFSLSEMEKISNSLIFVDEVSLLFDLDNRKKKRQIDTILRLMNHRGNKIFLCGLPSDFKKFLCAKAKTFIYKSLNISDLINGSELKNVLLQYCGLELGVYSLQLKKSEVLVFDGQEGFFKISFGYNKVFDTKKENKNLFLEKNNNREV